MLVDVVEVTIKAGDGGNGVVSFGKTGKSGPDGGNGGRGGDVYVITSSDLTLLAQFRGKEVVSAEDGYPGEKEKRHGKNGKDLSINLPVGSLLTDVKTSEILELDKVGETLLCKGGEGGTGNFDLRSSRNITPQKHKTTNSWPIQNSENLSQIHCRLRFGWASKCR